MHGYYHNILRKLNVTNYKQITNKLIFSNFAFFNNYAKYHKNQIGGDKTKVITAKFNFDGDKYLFKVFRNIDDYNVTYVVHNNDNKSGNLSPAIFDDTNNEHCVLIFYNKDKKSCYIENVNYCENCCFGMPYERGGTLLIKFTLDFIQNYLTKKHNIEYIQLKDNSQKNCEKIKKYINLDMFYMFTHGDTWLESTKNKISSHY